MNRLTVTLKTLFTVTMCKKHKDECYNGNIFYMVQPQSLDSLYMDMIPRHLRKLESEQGIWKH